MTRQFNNGAIRDTNLNKLEYIGNTHPLCEHSFAKYMDGHRTLPDGGRRGTDNWWGGWDKHVSLDSMLRHVMDLRALEAGLFVYKERSSGEITHYLTEDKPRKDWRKVTEEECCNSIRFNTSSYLLDILKH